MTTPFSPAQKFRILVTHGAVVLWRDEVVPLHRFPWATMSDTKRFGICRRLNVAVLCGCGCDVWSPLPATDFDHVLEHVSGGLTAISNGAPLRRQPCHAAKSARAAAVTGKVTRTKRKLSVTTGIREDDSRSLARTSRRSWPQRSFPKSSRPMQSRPFPKRLESRT